MQQLVEFAGMLLAVSAGAGQPGLVAMQSATVTTRAGGMAEQHNDAAGLICETGARHEAAPKLEVRITPPKVKIPDNSERGTRLAKVTVRWSNGKPFSGEVRLTKNPGVICQLSGMELQLGRDTTKGDDYSTSVRSVSAGKEENGIGQHLGVVPSSHFGLTGTPYNVSVTVARTTAASSPSVS